MARLKVIHSMPSSAPPFFLRERIQFNSIQSASKSLKKPGAALCVMQFSKSHRQVMTSEPIFLPGGAEVAKHIQTHSYSKLTA